MFYYYSATVDVHFIMSYGGSWHMYAVMHEGNIFCIICSFFSRSCLLSVQFMSLFSFLRKEIICQSPHICCKNY